MDVLQFNIRFIRKALICSGQGFNMFQPRSVLGPHYVLGVLVMFAFAMIFLYSAIEIGPYSLYRKKKKS